MATKIKRSSRRATLLYPTERQEHEAVIKWAKMMVDTNQEPRLRLLRSGFEGLRLSMGVRMQVKRQSICTGWPDMFLAVPQQFYVHCGLFIELKRRKGGVLSQEQREMNERLLAQGYDVCVCKGADEAIATIKTYLGI